MYLIFLTHHKLTKILSLKYFRTTQWPVRNPVPRVTEASYMRGRMGSRRSQRRMDTDRMEAAGIWWGANIRRLTDTFVRNHILKGTSRNIVSGPFFHIHSSLILVQKKFVCSIFFSLVWHVEYACLIKKYKMLRPFLSYHLQITQLLVILNLIYWKTTNKKLILQQA